MKYLSLEEWPRKTHLNTTKKIFDSHNVSMKTTLNITTNAKREILCLKIHT